MNSFSITASQITIHLAASTQLLAHSSVGQHAGTLGPGPHKAEIKVSGWATFPCGGCGEEFASKLTQVIGSIQFLAGVRLRSPYSYWLSDRGHSAPTGHPQSYHVVLSVFKANRRNPYVKSISPFESPIFPVFDL